MILTVAFGKGGTGKTSTVLALANYAKIQGKRVLCIDADPQANCTFAMGGNASAPGLYALLTGQTHATQVIQQTQQTDIISAGRDLAAAEMVLMNTPGRDFIIKQAIAPIVSQYDLIIFDTQPALNLLLYNALTASDAVILPMQANSFSFMGLYQMQMTIERIQQTTNPNLIVKGILLVKYKPRQTLASDLFNSIADQAQKMKTTVFNTFIHDSVAVEQAQAMQQSLYTYAPNNRATNDYKALYEEIGL